MFYTDGERHSNSRAHLEADNYANKSINPLVNSRILSSDKCKGHLTVSGTRLLHTTL